MKKERRSGVGVRNIARLPSLFVIDTPRIHPDAERNLVGQLLHLRGSELADLLVKPFTTHRSDLKRISTGGFRESVLLSLRELREPGIAGKLGFPPGDWDNDVEREPSQSVTAHDNDRPELAHLRSPDRLEINEPDFTPSWNRQRRAHFGPTD